MARSDWFWDWSAKRYDTAVHQDDDYRRAIERCVPHLSPDDTVLDFACGTGIFTFAIAPHVEKVHGIDASATMVDLARKRAGDLGVTNVQLARKTIFDEELELASYDVVLAFNILHLVENPSGALERVSHLLKANGFLIASTPCLGSAGIAARLLLPLISKVGLLSYLRSFNVSDMGALVRRGGFAITESETIEGAIPSVFLVAQKG